MTFTTEEEETLKLMVAELKGKTQLNKVNLDMGTAIRAEFAIIDKRIRDETRPIFQPLQDSIKATQDLIKGKF